MRREILILFAASVLSLPVAADTLTVGFDEIECDFTDLAQALASASSGDTLRLAAGEFVGSSGTNFNVNSKSLTLAGGYIGCSGARGSAKTVLRGGGSDSVVEAFGGGSRFLILEQLLIEGGEPDSDSGGGIGIEDDFDVTLLDVTVEGNESDVGGGIFIDGTAGATLFIGYGSEIVANHATVAGGGVACDNEGTVAVFAPATISQNTTGGDGGGIYASGNCDVRLQVSEVEQSLIISFNESLGNGGGLNIRSSSLLADGGPAGRILVDGNAAGPAGNEGWGGGLFATGCCGNNLFGIRFRNNAGDRGGAIFVNFGASVYLEPFSGQECTVGFCQELSGNTAPLGAAVGLRNLVGFTLRQALVAENSAASGDAPIAHISGDLATTLLVTSSVLRDNGIGDGFGVAGFLSTGEVRHNLFLSANTIAGNYGFDNLIEVDPLFLELNGVIFWDNPGHPFDPGLSDAQVVPPYCLLAPEGSFLPGSPDILLHADPRFVDPAGGDYHLRRDSPAIDACPRRFSQSGGAVDQDGDPRPIGDGWDIGSDEFTDTIFADGFETGNL